MCSGRMSSALPYQIALRESRAGEERPSLQDKYTGKKPGLGSHPLCLSFS